MPGLAGKKMRISVSSTSGGTYNVIAGIKSANHSIDGTNVDDSEFGVDWAQRIQGLKDTKLSLSGLRRVSDTLGQNFVRDALINDTQIFVKVLPDNGVTVNAGFQQEMKVTKFAVDASVDAGQGLSIELEGTSTVTLV